MQNQPRITELKNRFSERPLLFELIPPELDAGHQELSLRVEKLKKLYSMVEVNGINLPEIREEKGKSDKGKRKSKFKPRYAPRDYAETLREELEQTEIVICRVVVHNPPEKEADWLIATADKYRINNLILVGGEQEADHYRGLSVPEANSLVREKLNCGEGKFQGPGIHQTEHLLGNICIPTRRLETIDEPQRISYKIKSGADFFTTQIIGEADSPVQLLKDLDVELEKENLHAPAIFWSFAPIAEQKDINFMRWLGVKIPNSLENELLNSEDTVERSIVAAERILSRIQQVNSEMKNPCLIGLNISFMGLRNFDNATKLAHRLKKLL